MLASAINADSASAGISAVSRFTAGVTALGSFGDELGLSLGLIGTSMLAGTVDANSASARISTVSRFTAGVTTLGSLHNLSKWGRSNETFIHAPVLADAIDAKSAVSCVGAIT